MSIEPTPVRVLNPLYGGNFASDSAVSLPFVLPGELAEPEPELRILKPSDQRVKPACEHFGTCGGCHYQHANYPTQLTLKREILGNLLTGAGLPEIPEIRVESAEPLGYRNRIRLRIESGSDGMLRAGYSRRASNEFLPIRMCPIAAPVLWRAAETILQLQSDPLVHRWLTLTAELELFTAPDESKLQLQFFLRSAPNGQRSADNGQRSFHNLCEQIRKALPELVGTSATLDPELNRRTRRIWPGASWGAVGIAYPAAGRQYWVPRGAFFQVNRFLVDRLVELVTAGKSGELAWDLYAGVGLFTRALAESFAHVIAVEGAEASASALATLKSPTGKIEAVHAPTLDFLRARALHRDRPELIVLDPPRAGIGPEAAQLLTRIAATPNPIQIVYVSCDPSTLARDLAILTTTYTVESIHLIDLFPQTFHMETIVRLKLGAPPSRS